MEFTKIVALEGPNRWSRSSVLEAWIDLAAASPLSPEQLGRFEQRLAGWLPNVIQTVSLMPGGDADATANLAQWVGSVAAELVAMSGPGESCGQAHPAPSPQPPAPSSISWPRESFGQVHALSPDGSFAIAIACQEESLARGCLQAAQELCEAVLADRPFDFETQLRQLRELYDTVCLGPSTRAIVQAAAARGIPAFRLNRRSLVQLGLGAKQRRIMTAETDQTGAIAETISQDKQLTKRLLRSMGVPVPEGRIVDSPEDAWEAAVDITLPVVVKPRNGNHGRGVFTNLNTRDEILIAYEHAANEGDGVIVERYIPGAEHRVLVVGDRVVAATRGEAAFVTGDGRHTIEQLVEEQLNSDPRRGDDYAAPLSKIEYDPTTIAVLQRQGLDVDSVPAVGRSVLIQQNGNLSNDVTDQVHPEVAARAVEAARAVGLDIAGIDIVISDIGRPMEEQRAAVVEVNAGPGLQMHLQPSSGKPRPVGEAIVATLFKAGESGRIPIVGVTGAGASQVTRLVAHLLGQQHHTVGMALPEGIWIANRPIDSSGLSRGAALRNVLINPGVEAAALEISPSMVQDEGLVIDDCDVAVILEANAGPSNGHGVPQQAMSEPRLAERLLLESVRKCGAAVLPAAHSAAKTLAESSPGGLILYGPRADDAAFAQYRASGGHAVFIENKRIVATQGHRQQTLVSLPRLALLSADDTAMRPEPLLAAAAAALFLGVPADTIGERMALFVAGDSSPAAAANTCETQSVPA